jgi:hypothetical protein
MCELAEALGHVRLSDGAPLHMTPEHALELVRELRDERDALVDAEIERRSDELASAEPPIPETSEAQWHCGDCGALIGSDGDCSRHCVPEDDHNGR